MTTVLRERKPLKQVSVTWKWYHFPVWPCSLLKDGRPGLLESNGAFYDVLPLSLTGYRLRKVSTGDVHDVDCTPAWGWQCDCGDATFRPERPGGCRHVAALREALASLWDVKEAG